MKKDISRYEHSVVFLVTSVIFITSAPLCYTPIRSVFNPAERAKQTVRTLESIRDRVPNARILLIESGFKRELPFNLSQLADHYIFIGDELAVREATDSKFKGLGEAISLIQAKSYILNETTPLFIKLSGRYFLSDEFNLDNWDLHKFNVRVFDNTISTCLYGFPQTYSIMWLEALEKIDSSAKKRRIH